MSVQIHFVYDAPDKSRFEVGEWGGQLGALFEIYPTDEAEALKLEGAGLYPKFVRDFPEIFDPVNIPQWTNELADELSEGIEPLVMDSFSADNLLRWIVAWQVGSIPA